MRILLATPHIYLPQGTGGLEVNTHVLCRGLIRRGHDAQVFCALHDTPYELSRWGLAKARGRRLLHDRRLGYPVYRARYPILSVPEAVAAIKPDIVVAQGWNAGELAAGFIEAGIPTLLYLHNAQRFDGGDAGLDIIANSRFTASLHQGHRLIGIVPPLIEPQAFRVESSRERVLFVNPIAQKGLTIAADLARARPDIEFDFYESWRLTRLERDYARSLTDHLDNIHWYAAVGDMRRAYRRARLILFPSAMETWGRVASEAHVSGIPTLASDRGALPDTVGPGGLCLPFDAPPEQWLGALSHLWDEPETYQGYAEAAMLYARRDEIAPCHVLTHFVSLLESWLTGARAVYCA